MRWQKEHSRWFETHLVMGALPLVPCSSAMACMVSGKLSRRYCCESDHRWSSGGGLKRPGDVLDLGLADDGHSLCLGGRHGGCCVGDRGPLIEGDEDKNAAAGLLPPRGRI